MGISMVEVAAKAGVSVATVSRIMNGKTGFSEETRLKVEGVIAELGYQKNELASSLKRNNSQTIGVIIPSMTTNYHGLIVDGIETKAREAGYSVLLSHSGNDGEFLEQSLQTLGERRVQGILLVSIQPSQDELALLNKLRIPYLFISASSSKLSYPYVKIDDYQGAFEVTTYLISQGHQQIAFVGANLNDQVAGKPRLLGYQAALKAQGFVSQPELVLSGDFGLEKAKQGMLDLLRKKLPVTAVFAASDEAGIGVIKACLSQGLQVPRDISVCGFDDSQTALLSTPELTTLHQPLEEMGEKSVTKLIAVCEGQGSLTSEIFPHRLIERQSVKTL